MPNQNSRDSLSSCSSCPAWTNVLPACSRPAPRTRPPPACFCPPTGFVRSSRAAMTCPEPPSPRSGPHAGRQEREAAHRGEGGRSRGQRSLELEGKQPDQHWLLEADARRHSKPAHGQLVFFLGDTEKGKGGNAGLTTSTPSMTGSISIPTTTPTASNENKMRIVGEDKRDCCREEAVYIVQCGSAHRAPVNVR